MTCPSPHALGLALSFLLSFCHSFSAAPALPPRRPGVLPLGSQVLDFIEPTTGVAVRLVGAMHYNPRSIQLAVDSIDDLEADGRLGSIVVESCDLRWNATMENELMKDALRSEMKAAHDLGIKYNRPVVLGDQRINVTVAELKNGAKEAVLDLVQPWNGGWDRLTASIASARKEAVPFGDQFLGLGSYFDPKLLAAAPVSLVKYPLSYAVRSPVFAAVVTALFLLGGVDSSEAYVGGDTVSTTEVLESLALSVLEVVIFGRIFLKELLQDRNVILADAILQQCRNYETASDDGNWLDKLLQTKSKGDRATGAVYAPDSVVGRPEGGKTVVAVLGLAHCNGIKKLLTEPEV